MGSLLSKVIGSFLGNQPCESFLKDFPANLGKLSLPSVVLDGLGVTCSGGNRSGPLINLAGNITSAIVLYVVNKKVGFMKSLGKLIPKLFTSDEATNATIFEYLVINIVLFFFDAVFASRKSVYDAKTPGEAVQNCLSDLVQCSKDAIAYLGELKSPTCAKGLDTDAGLCYKPCKDGYTGVGPVCWSATPPASEGWRDDGAFIHQSYARPQHWQIDLPMPGKCVRDSLCGADCSAEGPYDAKWVRYPGIGNKKFGEDVSAIFGPGYRRGVSSEKDTAWIVRGGHFVNCELFGQGCKPGEEKHGSMCYDPPKPGYHCDLVTCYKDCPAEYTDIGISCAKKSYGRGVGEVPAQCPKGYRWDGALACGPTDEYMRRLQEGKDPTGSDEDDSSSTGWIPWVIGGGVAAAGVAYLALRK